LSASSPAQLPSDAELEERLGRPVSPADAAEFTELARLLAGVGRAKVALRVAQRAVEAADQHRDPVLRVAALRSRARAQGELAEYTGVVRSLLEAQSLNREIDDPKQELLILSTLGMAYGKLGVRAEAIASHEAALALAARYAPEFESECYGNLGITLVNCERATEALSYMHRALALAEQSPDEANKLRARVNLNAVRAAAAELRMRRLDDAAVRAELHAILAECESVLVDCRAAHADAFIPPVIQHIGIVHKCLGDFAMARARFGYVTAMARERGWKRLEVDVLLHVGAMESQSGNFAVAEEALTRALGYYEAAQYKTAILETHLELAKLYERMRAYERAYAAMKKHYQIRLEMAASEDELRIKVRAWREEYDAMQRQANEAQRAAATLADENAALAARNRSLAHEARHDPLTGLANRRHGDEWIEEQFRLHTMENRVLALAVLDLDHFKSINDRYSHVSGDMVLTQVADLLRAACRDSDLAIRFGGDEFLIAFPNTNAEQAEAICERLRMQFDKHAWRPLARGLHVTGTIGVADSREAQSALDLLRIADARLYRAKRARSRVA
jgi:diguanylate cyclase (GGDEF)-like protein